MAFSATTIWEVQTGGADGNSGNGGGFDPSNASMATDLAATSATGNSPVVTSASYNFAARDVGHWVYVQAGTNWTPGWYQIASVNLNAATLSAAVGAAVTGSTLAPSTVAGCATTASPTAGTWSIDYSQTGAAGVTFTDMVIDGVSALKFTSTLKPVGPNYVGNIIAVSSGTGFTVQRVQVSSVSGTTATCDKSLGTFSSTGGNGILGGALASPGQAGALHVASNDLYIKSGTYSITSASSNVAAGCLSWTASASASNTGRITGYGTVRGDFATRPLLQASGIGTFTILTTGANNTVQFLAADGASLTSSKGFSISSGSRAYRIKGLNCTNSGIVSASSTSNVILGEATGCSTAAAILGGNLYGCTSHDNTNHGFSITTSGCHVVGCLASNNTGANINGFTAVSVSVAFINCTSYGNTLNGFYQSSTGTAIRLDFINCLATNNGAYGFDSNGASDYALLVNCYGYSNSSGDFDAAAFAASVRISCTSLSGDPFTNAAGNDFSLSNTTAGNTVRAGGIPGAVAANQLPGLSTLAYHDAGAAQHQDNGANVVFLGQKRDSYEEETIFIS